MVLWARLWSIIKVLKGKLSCSVPAAALQSLETSRKFDGFSDSSEFLMMLTRKKYIYLIVNHCKSSPVWYRLSFPDLPTLMKYSKTAYVSHITFQSHITLQKLAIMPCLASLWSVTCTGSIARKMHMWGPWLLAQRKCFSLSLNSISKQWKPYSFIAQLDLQYIKHSSDIYYEKSCVS